MTDKQQNNSLHGVTLEKVVASLVERYGWDGMAQRINVNCFKSDPSINSSLKFLRKKEVLQSPIRIKMINVAIWQVSRHPWQITCPIK